MSRGSCTLYVGTSCELSGGRRASERKLSNRRLSEALPSETGLKLSESYSTPASVRQDPHIHFAHGGQADFRGHNGVYYNFFSSPRMSVNVKTEDASFRLHGGKLIVHGSFLTEVHIVGYTNAHTLAHASFWAAELNRENWGWTVINGTCKSRYFVFGRRGRKQCGDLAITMSMSTANFTLGSWTVTARGNHVYDWLAGPKHRVDVSFAVRGDAAARSLPHGIIGQSFSSAAPRHGLLDAYPEAGNITTSAMAEGAIEGQATLYEMPSSHATDFLFSRFGKREETLGGVRGGIAGSLLLSREPGTVDAAAD